MDVYLEKTSSLLSSLELPYSNGFDSYTENIGTVENKGFELAASLWLLRDTERRVMWSVTEIYLIIKIRLRSYQMR